MKTLRLLLFAACDRSCPGCCNNDWDLKALPVCDSFAGYDEIILTGGEPMLRQALVYGVAVAAHAETPDARVYVYTAMPEGLTDAVLSVVDGVTPTLPGEADVERFQNMLVDMGSMPDKSLRLNVFAEVDLVDTWLGEWQIKSGIEWIEDCPLPEHETFMRLS